MLSIFTVSTSGQVTLSYPFRWCSIYLNKVFIFMSCCSCQSIFYLNSYILSSFFTCHGEKWGLGFGAEYRFEVKELEMANSKSGLRNLAREHPFDLMCTRLEAYKKECDKCHG